MITVNDFLNKFNGVQRTGQNQWMVKCPCHNDKKASLAISQGNTGAIVFHCQAGCDKKTILDTVGVTWKDITPDKTPAGRSKRENKIVDIYKYPHCEKIRFSDKTFCWRRPDGKGGWIYNRNGVPHDIYVQGSPAETIYIVEGEKDCNNLAKLGYYCASPENGAGNNQNGNKWYESYNATFKDKQVRILCDNDEIGHQFASDIAEEIKGVAKEVRIFDLKNVWAEIPPKADISDVIQSFGADKTREMIKTLENQSAENKTITIDFSTDKVFQALDKSIKSIDGNEKIEIKTTAENFLTIFRMDEHFANVRFNTLRGYPEKLIKGKRYQWLDPDDAMARVYIESTYHINNRQKCEDAFQQFQQERAYNPLQEHINTLKWDGVARCESFLIKWMGAEDNAYNREVSRLIFAGGINRAYRAGCKFDDVPVLQGGQGAGKSTLVSWLAMQPDFYASTKTISGKTGLESIQGKWIIEIEELLATIMSDKQGQKIEETAKAFLSTQSDFYRKPYDKRPSDTPRSCIFIGTTNRDQFLTDKTGNRRWFPVRCKANGYNLFDHKEECQEYIRQCWAEMKSAFDQDLDLAKPMANKDLISVIQEKQAGAECEDWREGVITAFLENKDKTCVIEVWEQALYPDSPRKPDRKESNDVAEIIVNHLGWQRGKKCRFDKYGTQSAFYRNVGFSNANDIEF